MVHVFGLCVSSSGENHGVSRSGSASSVSVPSSTQSNPFTTCAWTDLYEQVLEKDPDSFFGGKRPKKLGKGEFGEVRCVRLREDLSQKFEKAGRGSSPNGGSASVPVAPTRTAPSADLTFALKIMKTTISGSGDHVSLRAQVIKEVRILKAVRAYCGSMSLDAGDHDGPERAGEGRREERRTNLRNPHIAALHDAFETDGRPSESGFQLVFEHIHAEEAELER